MRGRYIIKSVWHDDEKIEEWNIPVIEDVEDDELVDEYIEEARVGFRAKWFEYIEACEE